MLFVEVTSLKNITWNRSPTGQSVTSSSNNFYEAIKGRGGGKILEKFSGGKNLEWYESRIDALLLPSTSSL